MAKKKISDLEEIQLSEMNGNEVLPLSKNGKSYRARVSLVGEFIVDNFDIQGGGGGGSVSVVNNLESTSPSKALSANMGRVLDEKIASTNTSLEGVSSSITGVRSDVSNIQSIMNGQSQSIQKLWGGVNINSRRIQELDEATQANFDALDEAFEQANAELEESINQTTAQLRKEIEDAKVLEEGQQHCVVEVSYIGDVVAHLCGADCPYGYSEIVYDGGRNEFVPSVRVNGSIVVFSRIATYHVEVLNGNVVQYPISLSGVGISQGFNGVLEIADNFRIEDKGIINLYDIESVDSFMNSRDTHVRYCIIGNDNGEISDDICVEVPLDVRTQYKLPSKLNVGDMLVCRNGELQIIANELNKDRITITQSYYDDGSGYVVPVKRPDLATQPNILPYKLAGNYVYEQLIPIPENMKFSTSNGYVKFSIDAPKWEIDKPSVLKATLMSSNVASVNEPQMCIPCIVSNAGDSFIVYVSDVLLAEKGSLKDLWLLLEYSSFDNKNKYYGYDAIVVSEDKKDKEDKYVIQFGVYGSSGEYILRPIEDTAFLSIGSSYLRDIQGLDTVVLTNEEVKLINGGLSARILVRSYNLINSMHLKIGGVDFGKVNTSLSSDYPYYSHYIEYPFLSYKYNGADTTRAWIDKTILRFASNI